MHALKQTAGELAAYESIMEEQDDPTAKRQKTTGANGPRYESVADDVAARQFFGWLLRGRPA